MKNLELLNLLLDRTDEELRETFQIVVGAINLNEPPGDDFVDVLIMTEYDRNLMIFQMAHFYRVRSISSTLWNRFFSNKNNEKLNIAKLLKIFTSKKFLENYINTGLNPNYPIQVRRYIIEGIENLIYLKKIKFLAIKEFLDKVIIDSDPSIRQGAIGVLMSIKDNPNEKRTHLMKGLQDGDKNVVMACLNAIRLEDPQLNFYEYLEIKKRIKPDYINLLDLYL